MISFAQQEGQSKSDLLDALEGHPDLQEAVGEMWSEEKKPKTEKKEPSQKRSRYGARLEFAGEEVPDSIKYYQAFTAEEQKKVLEDARKYVDKLTIPEAIDALKSDELPHNAKPIFAAAVVDKISNAIDDAIGKGEDISELTDQQNDVRYYIVKRSTESGQFSQALQMFYALHPKSERVSMTWSIISKAMREMDANFGSDVDKYLEENARLSKQGGTLAAEAAQRIEELESKVEDLQKQLSEEKSKPKIGRAHV